MKYSYYGGGQIRTGSWGLYHELIPIIYKFARHSVAYIRHQAELGKLEPVQIDRVWIGNNSYTYRQPNVMYVDILNSLFNEKELCTLPEANDLINEALVMMEFKPKTVVPERKNYHEDSFPTESKYQKGQILFSKKSAQMGELEKIVVYRALPNNLEVYEDNLKGLWTNDDLVDESTAKSLALIYWKKRKDQIKEEINKRI